MGGCRGRWFLHLPLQGFRRIIRYFHQLERPGGGLAVHNLGLLVRLSSPDVCVVLVGVLTIPRKPFVWWILFRIFCLLHRFHFILYLSMRLLAQLGCLLRHSQHLPLIGQPPLPPMERSSSLSKRQCIASAEQGTVV